MSHAGQVPAAYCSARSPGHNYPLPVPADSPFPLVPDPLLAIKPRLTSVSNSPDKPRSAFFLSDAEPISSLSSTLTRFPLQLGSRSLDWTHLVLLATLRRIAQAFPPIRFDRCRLDSHSHSCSHFYSHHDPPNIANWGIQALPFGSKSTYTDLAAVTLKYTPQPPSAAPRPPVNVAPFANRPLRCLVRLVLHDLLLRSGIEHLYD